MPRRSLPPVVPIVVCVLASVVALWNASANAVDISIPLPKPSLPSIPLPRFLDEPRKKLGEDELKAIDRANDEDPNGRARIAGATSPAPSPGAAPRDADATVLAPQFSDRLPYSVVLGMVVCESNFPLDEVGGLQAEITQLQKDLIDYLNVPQSNEKIELCLFKDKESYASFIRAIFPGAPLDRPALYVKESGPGVLMVQRDANMIVNVRHEMTHAYLNASLRRVPIWLDEGLAKYFETPPGERGFRNPYLKDVEESASGFFSSPPSLSRLEKLERVDQMRAREYRESWSWVHFMLHYSRDTHLVLANYLRTLRPETQQKLTRQEATRLQKKAPLKQALEKYVPDYQRKYVEHFKNWDARKEEYEKKRASADFYQNFSSLLQEATKR